MLGLIISPVAGSTRRRAFRLFVFIKAVDDRSSFIIRLIACRPCFHTCTVLLEDVTQFNRNGLLLPFGESLYGLFVHTDLIFVDFDT